MTKMTDNPIPAPLPFQESPRCTARSKRTLKPCGQPAVNGWKVCRLHGAGGGAPCGPRHGNYKHGMKTKEAIAARRQVRELIRESREFMRELA